MYKIMQKKANKQTYKKLVNASLQKKSMYA